MAGFVNQSMAFKGKDLKNGVTIERLYMRKKRNNRILLKTLRDYARYNEENHYYTYGRMCNHSKGGICFECDRAIQPGVNISLKIIDFSPEHHKRPIPSAHKTHKATVKWCKQLKNTPGYGIGAQFFDKKPVLPV